MDGIKIAAQFSDSVVSAFRDKQKPVVRWQYLRNLRAWAVHSLRFTEERLQDDAEGVERLICRAVQK